MKDILKIPQTLCGIILASKDIKGFVEYLGFDWNLASEAIKSVSVWILDIGTQQVRTVER